MAEILENPYVGPRPFERSERDHNRFFGRDLEARELLSLVLSEQLVLFYAQSGAGKSSLINARLVYDLAARGFFVLPVARVSGQGRQTKDGEWVDNVFIFSLLHNINDKTSEGEKKPVITARMTLSQYLRLYSEPDLAQVDTSQMQVEFLPQILIIDQFEELFTTHPAAWKQREDFFKQVRHAMEEDPKLWVLLVMREDFTAQVDPYAYLFPNRLRTRFYMQRLGPLAAQDAVRSPAGLTGLGFEPRQYGEGVAQKLVERLTLLPTLQGDPDSHDQFVEPLILQVVCFSLWEKLREGPAARPPGEAISLVDLDQAGGIDQALVNYYEEMVIRRILEDARQAGQHDFKEIDLRLWIENNLITPGGQRSFVYESEQPTQDLTVRFMHALYEKRLLNQGQREKRIWYELAHDRLVHPIQISNTAWQNRQNLLAQAAYTWAKNDKNPALLALAPAIEQAVESAGERDLDPLVWEFVIAARKQMKRNLSATGWGVIFLKDADPALREALGELLQHRRQQASQLSPRHYHEFEYQPGENYLDFLSRYKAPEGETNPSAVPYYLLIVGSPVEIPFAFQYQLDINYAVGRIYFERLEEYACYAHSVVEAESGRLILPRQAVLFGVVNPDNAVTRDLLRLLIDPVNTYLREKEPTWEVRAYKTAEETGKARLSAVLGGPETPAILLTSSLSMQFSSGDAYQRRIEGALITGDWSGLRAEIDPQVIFSGDDLTGSAHPYGLVAFFMASRSAGTPQFENFYRMRGREAPQQLAVEDFLAPLAQRLLAHPSGGALAVIGHVDDAFPATLTDLTGAGEPASVFRDGLTRLLNGLPVGAAMEPFNQRCARLASMLVGLDTQSQDEPHKQQYRDIEQAMLDTRNYIVLGDPAVRLMVGSPEATPARPRLEPPAGTAILRYHPQPLRSAAWSPDGTRLLTVCADGKVRVWPVDSPQMLWTYSIPASSPDTSTASACWSPTGAQVAVLATDGSIYLLKAENGEVERALTVISDSSEKIAWSPDGRQLAVTSLTLLRGGYLARLIDLESGQVEAVLRGHTQPLRSIAYHPFDQSLLTGSADGSVRRWARNGEQSDQLDLDDEAVAAQFSQDGAQIITASCAGTVTGWNSATREKVIFLSHELGLNALGLSPDGRRMATASRKTRLWDLSTRCLWFVFRGHTGGLSDLQFHPAGDRLLTVAGDGTARLWNIPIPLSGEDERIIAGRYSPDSAYLLTAHPVGWLQLWDARSGLPLGRLEGNPTNMDFVMAFSPDSRWIASCEFSEGAGAQLWETTSCQPVRTFPATRGAVDALTFSPDNQILLSYSLDKVLTLWDVQSGAAISELPLESYLYSAFFSPDGQTLLAFGRDENVYLWQKSPQWAPLPTIRHPQGARCPAFDPSGTTVATVGADGTVRLWDIRTGQEAACLKGHSGGVNHVAFSPDGSQIITAGDDWTVRVWDVSSRRLVTIYADQQMAIRDACFSTDGSLILARSDSGGSIWPTGRNQPLLSFSDRQKTGPAIAFRPDGKQFLTIARGRAFLVKVQPGFLPELETLR